MSGAAVRFLFVAVAGWAVLRSATFGMLPGAEALALAKAEAGPSPSGPMSVPQAEPVTPQAVPAAYPGYPPYAGYPPYPPYPAYGPPPPPPVYRYYYAAPAPAERIGAPDYAASSSEPPPQFNSPVPTLEEWGSAALAPSAIPDWRGKAGSSAPTPVPPLLPRKILDRLQLSAWALLRGQQPGPGTLASGSTLGGSQAGARLTYAFDPHIAASLRSSSPVGGSSGGEVAAGVRLTPFPSIPLSLTAERRQAIGRFSTGRSAFAMFLEGGLYQKPLGWNLMLDGYAQAGVVGVRSHDVFADGGFTVTRPLYGRFSAGLGAWGGYQPGLYRVDAGPRLSMRVRPNVSVHLDWRQRMAGTAFPASGPAVTLGADF